MSQLLDSESYDKNDVEILRKEDLYQGFFKMTKYVFRHRLFAGGWSGEVEREMFLRGDAVALLPYDPVLDKVVLVEQFRTGALEGERPWQFEIVAGMIEPGESTEEVAARECQEEAGIDVSDLKKITEYYPSSGGCDERIALYIGTVDSSIAGGIFGLDDENEDIRVHVVDREEAYQWVISGKIDNAASIISLQWLQLNHHNQG
ncbi:ADP-ribose diphosphatase [Vibrio sp. SS-MA-C1-2]|uniref:ADP-ribose diphosphatase n=1 Tax=Vibrio sp. SS-MA-C1-2 TaxID=2908646 RepID=UPI001F42F76F|nr:ADP-ribose diphosphatase [Vibrio sp. SS-MA-C1-2]UJF19105.1 ADP-ribose diphosphatase [Vibrio sp. SS-MA-C1-2]